MACKVWVFMFIYIMSKRQYTIDLSCHCNRNCNIYTGNPLSKTDFQWSSSHTYKYTQTINYCTYIAKLPTSYNYIQHKGKQNNLKTVTQQKIKNSGKNF